MAQATLRRSCELNESLKLCFCLTDCQCVQRNPAEATPHQIGYAAGYEAYRSWKFNQRTYEPFGYNQERQREVLISLAVAEGKFL